MNSLEHPKLVDPLDHLSLPSNNSTTTPHPIVPELLVPHLKSNTKIGAIKELVDLLCQAGYVQDGLLFLQSVLTRENLESTIIGPNIALPHARSQAVSHLGMALGLSPTIIDFPSGDKRAQINIVCLVAAPLHTPGLHLDLMKFLAQRFAMPRFIEAMCQTTTKETIYQLLDPATRFTHLV